MVIENSMKIENSKLKISGKMPTEYKRGYVNFLGCKIALRFRPMIPRKETAFWVKQAIKEILKKGENFAFLDIFCGSGCIGLSVLKNCSKRAKIAIFSDIDEGCVKQTKFNLKLNKIKPHKYRVLQSDIFQNIKGAFDYIFANPPYVGTQNKYLVQDSVLEWEPHLAIFGGRDGLLYIRKFLKEAKKFLKPKGKIYLEFDHLHKNKLEKILPQFGYKHFHFHKDQFGRWRWVEICKN